MNDLTNLHEIEPRRGKRKMQEFEIENQENQETSNKADNKANHEKLNSNSKYSSYDKLASRDKMNRMIDRENKPFGTSVAKQKEITEREEKLLIKRFTPGINLSNNLLGFGEADGKLPAILPALQKVVVGNPLVNIMSVDLSFN